MATNTTEEVPREKRKQRVFEQGGPSTKIDRRKAQRVVPLEVMGFGLSRSGTSSLRQALFALGYDDVYHYTTVWQENPSDAAIWADALKWKYEGIGKPFGRKEWDALLGHCMAITDTPCVMFAPELLAAYPEAKVILTVRDSPESWVKSYDENIYRYMEAFHDKSTFFKKIYQWLSPKQPFYEMNELLMKHRDIPLFKGKGKDWYIEHNEEIKRLVPKEDLLVFNVKEGWEPLCQFLDKPVPEKPFPKINDTVIFQEGLNLIFSARRAAVIMRVAFWAGTVVIGAGAAMYAMRSSSPKC